MPSRSINSRYNKSAQKTCGLARFAQLVHTKGISLTELFSLQKGQIHWNPNETDVSASEKSYFSDG